MVIYPVIILVMGVAGSGKTTLGKALAKDLGWEFQEGDDFHPPGNIEKMSAGVPLSDSDRYPWLDHVKSWINEKLSEGGSGIITCSALKRSYRAYLGLEREGISVVLIGGQKSIIEDRLKHRSGHFMPPSLLRSQLEAMEPPLDNEKHISVDAGMTTDKQIEVVKRQLGLGPV